MSTAPRRCGAAGTGAPCRPGSARGARSPPRRRGRRSVAAGAAAASPSARGSRSGRRRPCRPRRARRRRSGPRRGSPRGDRSRSAPADARRRAGREVERLADRGEHAEAEDVDLEEAERVEVVLVPRDHRAVRHRRRLDGRDVRRAARRSARSRRRGSTGAAGSPGSRAPSRAPGARARRSGRTRTRATRSPSIASSLSHHETSAAEPVDLLERQAERLAHLAERALAAVRDDLAHHRGAVAPVRLVDGLDDLFAPLVLEVDVDVGRLAALGGEEALEEQVAARRIDRGDAEAVADGAVRRAAAPLAEDVARRAPSRRSRGRSGSTARPRASR